MCPLKRFHMCETVSDQTSTRRVQQFRKLLRNDELHSEAVMNLIFGITQREARTYLALHNRGENTAQDLGENLDRHPSNVYEALNGLYETGLVTRRRRVPEHGGQEYVFSSVPVQEATQIIRNEFERWVAQMRDELDTLESGYDGQ